MKLISFQEELDITNFLLKLENETDVYVDFRPPPYPDGLYYPRNSSKIIGLEHTCINELPGKRGGNELIRIRSLVEAIFKAARTNLNALGYKNLDVQISFNPQELLLLKKGAKGKELSIIAAVEHMMNDSEEDEMTFTSSSPEIDPIFWTIDITRDMSYPRVIISEYYSTSGEVSVTEMIDVAFLRKAPKLKKYDTRLVHEMWLLIVCPNTFFSPEYSIPSDISFLRTDAGAWDRAFYYNRVEMIFTELRLI